MAIPLIAWVVASVAVAGATLYATGQTDMLTGLLGGVTTGYLLRFGWGEYIQPLLVILLVYFGGTLITGLVSSITGAEIFEIGMFTVNVAYVPVLLVFLAGVPYLLFAIKAGKN